MIVVFVVVCIALGWLQGRIREYSKAERKKN